MEKKKKGSGRQAEPEKRGSIDESSVKRFETRQCTKISTQKQDEKRNDKETGLQQKRTAQHSITEERAKKAIRTNDSARTETHRQNQ